MSFQDGVVVVTHTQQELEQERDRLLTQLALIDSLPPRGWVRNQLGHVRFLLGEPDDEADE